jgi:hypothetical protein
MTATVHRLATRLHVLTEQIKANNPTASRAELAAILTRTLAGPYKRLIPELAEWAVVHHGRELAAAGNKKVAAMLARSKRKKKRGRQ